MIPHEPILAFTRKNDKRKKTITLVMLMICVQTLEIQILDFSMILRLFSAFGLFLSWFVVVMAQILHKEGAL